MVRVVDHLHRDNMLKRGGQIHRMDMVGTIYLQIDSLFPDIWVLLSLLTKLEQLVVATNK